MNNPTPPTGPGDGKTVEQPAQWMRDAAEEQWNGGAFEEHQHNEAIEYGAAIIAKHAPRRAACLAADGREELVAWRQTSECDVSKAVNLSCTCGGRIEIDPKACPACMTWHRLFGKLAMSAERVEERK